MAWPFEKPNTGTENPPVADPNAPPKPPEKSQAELIAEALSPFSQTLQSISQRIETIEQRTAPRRSPEENQPLSVLDDENAAFAQRLSPIMLRQLELESRVVRGDIKTEYERAGYGELWERYSKEISETLDGSPLFTADGKPLRGDPAYVRNVVDMVFGREARKAGMRFDGKNKGFFLETGGTGEGAGAGAPVNDGLSDAQRRVFGRMKVSLDDAKKVMTKLQFVS